MHVTSEDLLDAGTVRRTFTLDDVPGVLWSPAAATPQLPVPLIVLGHPGGLEQMLPRLEARARSTARSGLASVALELPGAGDRPRITEVDLARDELRRAVTAGGRPDEDVVDRLVLPLVEQTVPEWEALLDAALSLPWLRQPVGVSGGITAIGVRFARVEPRVAALGLFAGTYVPRSIIEEARHVTVPAHVLLQWDDRGNDRQRALELFDALGSMEKTLQANTGGHTGVPAHAAEDAARFFVRHLG